MGVANGFEENLDGKTFLSPCQSCGHPLSQPVVLTIFLLSEHAKIQTDPILRGHILIGCLRTNILKYVYVSHCDLLNDIVGGYVEGKSNA